MKRIMAFLLVLSVLMIIGCQTQQAPQKPSVPQPPIPPVPTPTIPPMQDTVAEVGNSITAIAVEEQDLSMEDMDDLDQVLSDIEKI